MPRFYLDLECDGVVNQDQEGSELSDESAARQEGERSCREILKSNQFASVTVAVLDKDRRLIARYQATMKEETFS